MKHLQRSTNDHPNDFKFIAQGLQYGEKNNHGVVKFPNLNSGVMSSTSIERQICGPDRVLKDIRRKNTGKRTYSVVFCTALELLPP